MTFLIPSHTQDLISSWWNSVKDAVAGLVVRCSPAGGGPAPRLSRIEAGAIATALDIFEALVRRMLVVLSAGRGPRPMSTGRVRLLFRIDELPAEPVIRVPRAEDPDYCLKPPPERALPSGRAPDGLVSAAPLLRRLAALAHVFDNAELYLDAMQARLGAPLKPLASPQPPAFSYPALTPGQATATQHRHDVALEAQHVDSS
ncbi:MAG: hypothetical protein R3B98_08260 [Hyphomonas sp.]